MLIPTSQVNYFCDNFEVVNNILKLKGECQYYDECINTADYDAMYLLKNYIASNFNIQHVRSHQDKRKTERKLRTVERINIKADKLVGNTWRRPINSHTHTPFAIYINIIYHPNKYRNKIRSTSGEREVREFLMTKYNWTGRVIYSIEWDLVTMFISNQTYATRKTMTNFSRIWLMSNSKTIDNQILYPYCQTHDASLDHDHYLMCSESGERKEAREENFQMLLAHLKIPKQLTIILIQGLDIAYRDRNNNSSSTTTSTHHHEIGWEHFIWERLLKECITAISNYYKKGRIPQQRFTGTRRAKVIIKFLLETHVNEWKFRCNLNFQAKSSLHNNELM